MPPSIPGQAIGIPIAMPSIDGIWVHLPGYILSVSNPQPDLPDNGSLNNKSSEAKMYVRDTALPISHPSPKVEDNNRERSPFNEIIQSRLSHAISYSPHIQGTSQRRKMHSWHKFSIFIMTKYGVLHVRSRSEFLESSYDFT